MRKIAFYLRSHGFKVWVDNEKLVPGTVAWEESIENAIKKAFAVIVILSPDSKSSEWVRREISYADQFQKRVFPVLVKGSEEMSLPIRLITRQYVDLRKDEEAGLEALLAAILLFVGLGSMGLTDRDEGRNAEAGREMLESGDWISPTFNYEPRYAKAALVYWLMTVSYKLFGVSEFSARFPSAIFGLGLILLQYLFVSRFFGATVGLFGALMLLLNFEMIGLCRMFIAQERSLSRCSCPSTVAYGIGVCCFVQCLVLIAHILQVVGGTYE